MMRNCVYLILLQACTAGAGYCQIAGPRSASTGAGNVPPGLEIQVAEQGTKLSEMDVNTQVS
jgi:hypothetical protein